MKQSIFGSLLLLGLLLLASLTSGCKRINDGKPGQIEDRTNIGCIVATDFYAIHFSAYLQSTKSASVEESDKRAIFKPYCREIPGPGKVFFSADLIDRDIRATPIGIRLVEIEKTDINEVRAATMKETRTLMEVEPKIYKRGVVEAQAELDKNGYYALTLLIGGDEALAVDDRIVIPLQIGAKTEVLSTPVMVLLAIITCYGVSRFLRLFLASPSATEA